MHVLGVQYDITWEDKSANHRVMEGMIAEANPPRGAFVVLPELGDTGFSFDLDVIVDDRTLAWAATIARRFGVWVQAGHAERGADGRGLNCATIISPPGDRVGTYRKVHPFSYSREIEHYTGGDRLLLASCADAWVCPQICYDLRFPELWRRAARPGDGAGAEVFTIGASWPDARQAHWRALLIARAIENQAFVVGVNRVGRDPQLGYVGGSIIVDPTGAVLAEAGDGPEVIRAELDLDALRAWRRTFPALEDVRADLLGTFAIDRVGGDRAEA